MPGRWRPAIHLEACVVSYLDVFSNLYLGNNWKCLIKHPLKTGWLWSSHVTTSSRLSFQKATQKAVSNAGFFRTKFRKNAAKEALKHLWELNDSFPFQITSFPTVAVGELAVRFRGRLVASNTCGWKFRWEYPKTAKYPGFQGNLTPQKLKHRYQKWP